MGLVVPVLIFVAVLAIGMYVGFANRKDAVPLRSCGSRTRMARTGGDYGETRRREPLKGAKILISRSVEESGDWIGELAQ